MISSRWLVSGKYYSHEGGHRTAAQLGAPRHAKKASLRARENFLRVAASALYITKHFCAHQVILKVMLWSFGGVVNALA